MTPEEAWIETWTEELKEHETRAQQIKALNDVDNAIWTYYTFELWINEHGFQIVRFYTDTNREYEDYWNPAEMAENPDLPPFPHAWDERHREYWELLNGFKDTSLRNP